MAKEGYASRKFLVTMTCVMLGAIMMVLGVLITAPAGYWAALPALFILLAAGISSYNWANLRQSQNGSAPR